VRQKPQRRLLDRLLSRLEPVYAALLRKDLLDFLCHPTQWSQILLFLAFWGIYLASVVNLNRYFDLHSPFWQLLIFFLNFAFASFFAAFLASRLVFPLISLEGRAFVTLRSTTLALENLLWVKLWAALSPVFFLTGSMVVVGDMVLQVPTGLFLASVLAIFLASLTLTSMALSLGAAFSRFGDRHPAQISNTPGGAYCLFLCLTTATLICVIFAWPIYLHYKFTGFYVVFPLTEWITATILIIALGILLTIFPMKIGLRALHRDLIV
jgi:ABC-2 type transport system permease protein